jgi:hypothetical protein
MKSSLLYCLFFFLIGAPCTQKKLNFKDFAGIEVTRDLSEVLTSYNIGSGFSLIYFENIKSEKKKKIIAAVIRNTYEYRISSTSKCK